MAKSVFSCVETRFLPRSRHCVAVLQTRVPKLCADLDLSLLYILISGTYSEFAQKIYFPVLGVCFPQPCSSAGRMFAVSKSHLQYYWRIISLNSMKCVVNWIPLRIRVRSRNPTPPNSRLRIFLLRVFFFSFFFLLKKNKFCFDLLVRGRWRILQVPGDFSTQEIFALFRALTYEAERRWTCPDTEPPGFAPGCQR